MRLPILALLGISALALSACDNFSPRSGPEPKAQANADCCCKDRCPTTSPASEKATAETETKQTALVATRGETVRTGGGHVRKAVRRGGGSSGYRYSYRSGTEGVGYLDEDLDGAYRGGYRRVGTSVSVEESETYEESRRSSESGYAYSSGGGSYEAYGYEGRDGYGGGHRKHGRRGGYAGVDRDGYLTWPGKTED